MNTALFLVQSPLHIHNAVEAIKIFSIQESTFLIVTSQRNKKWENMMLANVPSDSKIFYTIRNDRDIEACTKDYVKHIPYLKEQSFDFVFFSDSRLYIFVDIVNALQNKNTYLMDDGAGVIQTVATLKHTGKFFDITQSSRPERRKQIEQIKKKYDLWQLEPVAYNFFSAFDLESSEQFKVVENPMTCMSKSHMQVEHDQVLLLGQPFVNHNFMNSNAYLNCLERILKCYLDKKVVYFPHPREQQSDLDAIVKIYGVDIVTTDLSAEQYLMTLAAPPRIVCGFNSAALWYVAKFQPDIKVEAHRLKQDDIHLSGSQIVRRSSHLSIFDINNLVYDYFRQRMKVVDL